MTQPHALSTFVELDRAAWAGLADDGHGAEPLPLTATELETVRSLGDEVDLAEVRAIYLPLSRLLNLHVRATGQLHASTKTFLAALPDRTPYVVGIAGSVAVGKSTTARLLRLLLARWSDHPEVELVTTDGFLLPMPSSSGSGCCSERAFPSRTTGGHCCGSSRPSSPVSRRSSLRCIRT